MTPGPAYTDTTGQPCLAHATAACVVIVPLRAVARDHGSDGRVVFGMADRTAGAGGVARHLRGVGAVDGGLGI